MRNPIPYAAFSEALSIRAKRGIIPYQPNQLQRRYRTQKAQIARSGVPLRFLLLKHRQWGGTTEEQAQTLYLTACLPGNWAATIAQRDPDAEDIFQIALRMYDSVANYKVDANGDPLLCFKRKTDSSRRLDFAEAGSRFILGSAESKTFGHSKTLQKVHGSEFARWPNIEDMWAGIIGAVPDSGEITLETTANGAVGKFFELYQDAKASPGRPWTAIFFRWIEDPQYRTECSADEAHTILGEVAAGGGEFGAEEQDLSQRLAAEGIVLTAEQWKWRRLKRRELGQKFFEQYPEDDVSCFLSSGRPFFDLAKVAKCPNGTVIRKEEGGALWVYADPEAGKEYVLWADPAEGIESGGESEKKLWVDPIHGSQQDEGTDPSAWGIMDRATGQDVAMFLGYITPSELARQIDKWGRVYNNAVAGVERNNHGGTVLTLLIETYKYPEVYHHVDRLTNGSEERRPGWPTTSVTRPLMLDDLDMMVREGSYIPMDVRMKSQMQTFHINPKGKPEHKPGYHDDLILGRAIGDQIRKMPRRKLVWGSISTLRA